MALRSIFVALVVGSLLLMAACTAGNPDQIRQKTAEETAALKSNTKAVAEGIKEGLSKKVAVDLNKASKSELSGLPGITDARADRMIAERPYASAHQLVTRHVLTEDEYAQIHDRLIVSH